MWRLKPKNYYPLFSILTSIINFIIVSSPEIQFLNDKLIDYLYQNIF